MYIFAAAVAAALSAAAAFTPHMAGKGETEVCTARRNIGWAQIGVLFATFVTGERLAFWRAEARALEAENDRLRRQLANCRSDLDWPDPDAHAQMLQEAAGTDERSFTASALNKPSSSSSSPSSSSSRCLLTEDNTTLLDSTTTTTTLLY